MEKGGMNILIQTLWKDVWDKYLKEITDLYKKDMFSFIKTAELFYKVVVPLSTLTYRILKFQLFYIIINI